jgi:hypothetical protein
MRPLGRKPYKSPSKRDFHPPKGWVNWWESNGNDSINDESGNKAREKEKVKKEIEEELKEDNKI